MGEKGTVVSKQQLSDEFVNGFHACEETDVDAVWQVLFCLAEHDAEEVGEQCGGQDVSPLDAVGDGETVRQRSIVLHLTFLTLWSWRRMVKKFWGQ